MKKLLTLVALAGFAMSANAETLWTGTCTFANYVVESGDRPVFNPEDFSNAVIGDKIIISLTNYTADPETWHQVELYKYDGEKPVDGGALCQGVHVIDGMTSAEFVIDETLMGSLTEGPTCLAGTGYTVRNIELSTFDGVIWEGECMCPDWVPNPAVTLPGSKFATAQEGDHLVFTVEILTPGAWAAIQIDKATTFSTGPFGTVELSAGQTTVDIVLTVDLLASLTTDGINITGANFKLTKIELVKGNGEVPPVEENAIWTGSQIIDSWGTSINIPVDKCANIVAGSTLAFTVSNISGDDAQFCVKTTEGWDDMPSDIEGGSGNYIHLTDGDGLYYFEVNAAAAAEMTQNGFVITGPGVCTITKIELIEEAVVEDAIWTGSEVINDWANSFTVAADKFGNVQAGNSLAFTVSNVSGADPQFCIKSNLPEGWGEMPSDIEGGFGNYIHLTDGDGVYYFDINAEAATLINTYGLVIAGPGVCTITKIVLSEGSNGIADVVNDAAVAPVYNLQGIKVANSINDVNTAGIYICGGKKYIVK